MKKTLIEMVSILAIGWIVWALLSLCFLADPGNKYNDRKHVQDNKIVSPRP